MIYQHVPNTHPTPTSLFGALQPMLGPPACAQPRAEQACVQALSTAQVFAVRNTLEQAQSLFLLSIHALLAP